MVTKNGRPVFVALPINTSLADTGIVVSIAIKLYRNDVISLERAALLAGQGVGQFTEELARQNIPVVSYSAVELADELKQIK